MLNSPLECFIVQQFVNIKYYNETTDPKLHNWQLLAGMLMISATREGLDKKIRTGTLKLPEVLNSECSTLSVKKDTEREHTDQEKQNKLLDQNKNNPVEKHKLLKRTQQEIIQDQASMPSATCYVNINLMNVVLVELNLPL